MGHHAEVELCQEGGLQAALPCRVMVKTILRVRVGAALDDGPREDCDNAARVICDLMLTSSTSTFADASLSAGAPICQEQRWG